MTGEPYVNPLAAREPDLARGEYEPFTPEEAEEARQRELIRLRARTNRRLTAAQRRGDSGMAKHFAKLLRELSSS